MPDLNCLSHWFPLLEAAGLPVPRTVIVRAPSLLPLLDGEHPPGFDAFLAELRNAGDAVGWPMFLRTGHGAGKHQWRNTCFVPSPEVLPRHVFNLVEWSEVVSIFGLPHFVWAVRELLPTTPLLHAYEGMPVVREFRVFVRGGAVVCLHGYWPRAALIQGMPLAPTPPDASGTLDLRTDLAPRERILPEGFDAIYESLCRLTPAEESEVLALARRAGVALGEGAWSVDILDTQRGWAVTDVAVAAQSFHEPGCPHAAALQ